MRDGSGLTPDGTAGSGDGHQGPLHGAGSEPGGVHVAVQGGRTRIVLSGEVDADLGPDLQEAMSDAEATGLPIDVDAERVTFMDSSGIAFLARIATRAQGTVRVIRPPDTVRFLLEVTRIGELLQVVTDEASTAPEALPAPDAAPSHGLPTIGPSGRTRATTPVQGPDDVA